MSPLSSVNSEDERTQTRSSRSPFVILFREAFTRVRFLTTSASTSIATSTYSTVNSRISDSVSSYICRPRFW